MELSENDGPRMVAEWQKQQAARPVKAKYRVATLGARTARGGEVVTASTGINTHGHRVACVGDLVRYTDGGVSAIVSGAGDRQWKGAPLALVGSATANGDTITETPASSIEVVAFVDGEGTRGLLEIGYGKPIKPNVPRGLVD